jgi:hypothetical protein
VFFTPGGIQSFKSGTAASLMRKCASNDEKETEMSIFDQKYRVVAVENDRLVVRGILSGEVLTIVNPVPETPLRQEDYPPGKLIALSDPSTAPPN